MGEDRLFIWFCAIIAVLIIGAIPFAFWLDKHTVSKEERISQLEERVDQLEQRLGIVAE